MSAVVRHHEPPNPIDREPEPLTRVEMFTVWLGVAGVAVVICGGPSIVDALLLMVGAR